MSTRTIFHALQPIFKYSICIASVGSCCYYTAAKAFSLTNNSNNNKSRNFFDNSNNCRRSTSTTRVMSSASIQSFSISNELEIIQFPCLSDNYGYLIHDSVSGETAAIDTPEAKPYQDIINQYGWKLSHILNTHHHWDHTGGNLELIKNNNNVVVYGPEVERTKIPGITNTLKGGDEIKFGSTKAIILEVGGHTIGHIAYYFPNENTIFVGDSLFALGCGRMFEGTPSQFWKSLKTLRDLPDETTVFCAHEYTAANAKFAVSVEPGNTALMERATKIYENRKHNIPTVPSQLGLEKLTNPFLRCDMSDEIRKNVGVLDGKDSDEDAFAKVRIAKDNFRG